MIHLVDTNVPIVANNRDGKHQPSCVIGCIHVLQHIVDKGLFGLDSLGLILEEYKKHLNHSGMPNVGDAFYRFVFNNQANETRCKIAVLRRHSEREFVEFPEDPDLKKFDRSDRKFVAAAIVLGTKKTQIENAVDSDWWESGAALKRRRIRIRNICGSPKVPQ